MISLMLRLDALTDIETWLAHHAASRAIAKDARVFASGEKPASLFWVTAGELQLVRHTPQGERVILQRCSRGALAEASLFSDRYHCDGEAAVESLAWVLPLADFHAALTEADFSRAYTMWLSHTIRGLRGQCERLSLPRAEDRVLHYLREHGRFEREGCPLKTWAGALGMTHEHLYRTLSTLHREGRIRRTARAITLA
ncbi:MAG: Crp/Fnr family transcriptional regulator [Thiobacillus sp.]